MPTQLTRFGIDRNSAILSIACMEGYFTLEFVFATEKIFFRTTVLLGGSSVATHPINFVNNFVHYVSLFRALSCVFQVLLLLTTCRLCE